MEAKDDRTWKIRPPKGMAEFILRNCQDMNYLVFSHKTGTVICTCCNEEFSMEEEGLWLTHSSDWKLQTCCPRCGARAVPKEAKYGRKTLRDDGRIIWFRKHGAVTYMEMDQFVIDYQTPHPAVLVAPLQQIRLTKESQVRMDYEYGYWSPRRWHRVDRIRVKHPRSGMYGGRKEHTHIMWDTLSDVGTDLQYANLNPDRFKDEYFGEYDAAQRVITYMSEFIKYPGIELLEKAGFENIVMNRASGQKTKAMNIKGKDLRSILRLNKAEIRYLRDEDPTIGKLEDIKMIRRYWPAAGIEDIEDLSKLMPKYLREDTIRTISEDASWPKVMKLLLEEYRATGDLNTVGDYGDYLGWINKLGIRKDKRVIYPRNFGQAHDDMESLYEQEKDKVEAGKFAAQELAITGMTEPYILGDIMIRPAASPGELREESKILHHCVRTYVNKVAAGVTSILFIRKVEDPDTPWFTLELNKAGKIVQCRGAHNCSYPAEVGAFIDEWNEWRRKEMKRRNKLTCQTA